VSRALRRIDRLGWYVLAAIALACVGVVVPWALTRGDLAPGWTAAKVRASIAQCDAAPYPQPATGLVSAAACRCVTRRASRSVPLAPSAYALATAGQAQITRDTADCNRAFPAG
jgi:hypothetical protein